MADMGNFDQAREVISAYMVSNADALDGAVFGDAIAADMNFLSSNLDSDRQYRLNARRRVTASTHAYATRRASSTRDAGFMNESARVVSRAFAGSDPSIADPNPLDDGVLSDLASAIRDERVVPTPLVDNE